MNTAKFVELLGLARGHFRDAADEATERVAEANRQQSAVRAAVYATALADSGLVPGQSVLHENGRDNRRGILVLVEPYGWARVRLLKKDGTAGEREAIFYTWTTPQP